MIVIVLVILALAGVGLLGCGAVAFWFLSSEMAVQDGGYSSAPVAVAPSPYREADPSIAASTNSSTAQQDRARWVYPTNPEGVSGEIFKLDDTNWEETRDDAITYRFLETARTPDYVELFDEPRELSVQLHADHILWKRAGQNDWTRGQTGQWDEPAPQ